MIAGLQVALPAEHTPFKLAGDAAALFYGQLYDEVNRKELELAQQQELAYKLAELQADRAVWIGRCEMLAAFSAEYGDTCRRAADTYHAEALRSLREAELMYRVTP